MNPVLVREKLQQFLVEDIGSYDVTSETIFSTNEMGTAVLYAKEPGVLAGSKIIQMTYELLDPKVEVKLLKTERQYIEPSEKIAMISGPVRSILTGERVILNLLQRMSGIATATKQAVINLNSPHTKLCDTRKTTPGLRIFEKYAVTCGGGFNHRHGLYDGVMIKDNHIAACGSITKAIQKVRNQLGPMVKIEVETESMEQVLEAVEAKSDVIMLDNRTPSEINTLLEFIPNSIITEASGGITMDNLADYGQTNVDYISVGFITHSVSSLDISLYME